jgi:phenylalanyl-tRNA synthetase alpha subunit
LNEVKVSAFNWVVPRRLSSQKFGTFLFADNTVLEEILKERLEQIKQNALTKIEAVTDLKELDILRVRYLGKKGELTAILREMGKLTAEERPLVGKIANEVRESIEQAIGAKKARLEEAQLNENWQRRKSMLRFPVLKYRSVISIRCIK